MALLPSRFHTLLISNPCIKPILILQLHSHRSLTSPWISFALTPFNRCSLINNTLIPPQLTHTNFNCFIHHFQFSGTLRSWLLGRLASCSSQQPVAIYFRFRERLRMWKYKRNWCAGFLRHHQQPELKVDFWRRTCQWSSWDWLISMKSSSVSV